MEESFASPSSALSQDSGEKEPCTKKIVLCLLVGARILASVEVYDNEQMFRFRFSQVTKNALPRASYFEN